MPVTRTHTRCRVRYTFLPDAFPMRRMDSHPYRRPEVDIAIYLDHVKMEQGEAQVVQAMPEAVVAQPTGTPVVFPVMFILLLLLARFIQVWL